MAEEIQISELELKGDLAGDLVFPVESSTDTNSTTLSALKDWLKTFFVGLTEEEIIAGIKTFEKSIFSEGQFVKKTSRPYTATPTETKNEEGFRIIDSNGETFGGFETIQYASGTNAIQMNVRGKSGKYHRLYVQENVEGKVTYGFGQSQGAGWQKIPRSTGEANLFCWGASEGATSKTITFPIPFKDNHASVVITSNGGNPQSYQVLTSNITATSFNISSTGGASNQAFCWFAIGTADL